MIICYWRLITLKSKIYMFQLTFGLKKYAVKSCLCAGILVAKACDKPMLLFVCL